MLPPWKKSYHKLGQCIKKQRHYFADKYPSSQSYGFSNSHIWMWELDHKESWALKNRCFWTVVLEKALESPLDCKEIKLVHSKGNQSRIFNGCWSWSSNIWATWCEERIIRKDPDAGKGWGQEEKGTTEDETVGWNSLTQWPWIWANSGRWWRTGRPGMLQSMGSQRVRHTEQLNRTLVLGKLIS